MTGVIKKIVSDKAFGFITPDDKKPEDRDLFFHKSNVADGNFDDLREGDKVSFRVEQSDKGPNAVEVKRM